ncbi:hypothetical protein Emag_004250 [Eimeria magna]
MVSPEAMPADAAGAAGAASHGVDSAAAAAAASDPAAAAAAAAAASAAAGRPLSLNIAAIAHALGEQNGLRHRDFHRYRLYLSRRLKRLREQADLKQGRHRYACRPIPDNTNDPRHLLVVLLQAERAWSYGMQLKNDNANSPTPSAKLRAHSIRRFSKALRYARQLEALCKGLEPTPPPAAASTAATAAATAAAAAAAAAPAAYSTETALCDGKTCLDAAAYRCFMESVLQQEKGEWSTAAATLQQLQQLYVQLKRLSCTQPELESLYRAKQEDIEPVLRLCIFHSGDIRAAAAAAAQQEETVRSSRAQATAAAAAATKDSSSSGKPVLAVWRGAPVDPSKDRPRAAIAAALEVWRERQLLPVETLRSLAAAAAVAAAGAVDLQAAAPKLTDSDAQGWAEQCVVPRCCCCSPPPAHAAAAAAAAALRLLLLLLLLLLLGTLRLHALKQQHTRAIASDMTFQKLLSRCCCRCLDCSWCSSRLLLRLWLSSLGWPALAAAAAAAAAVAGKPGGCVMAAGRR